MKQIDIKKCVNLKSLKTQSKLNWTSRLVATCNMHMRYSVGLRVEIYNFTAASHSMRWEGVCETLRVVVQRNTIFFFFLMYLVRTMCKLKKRFKRKRFLSLLKPLSCAVRLMDAVHCKSEFFAKKCVESVIVWL